MRENMRNAWAIIVLALIVSSTATSQGQLRTLVVSGHAGSVPVTQIHGRSYVEVEALARVAKGTLSFQGNQITLTLATEGESAPPAAETTPAEEGVFSKEFLRAAIEEATTVREWHSALASAIENGFPFTHAGLSRFETQATKNLRLMQVASRTDADQDAGRLITNAYQKMKQLSDKYVTERENLRYVPTNALQNDALNQSLVECGRSLAAMAASGAFVDDGKCD